jgi:23S rRNA (pseudouridine1915-N3)-methyltransferase
VKINIIAVGDKMPVWIKTGYEEYAKRFPQECNLNLIAISPRKPEAEILKKIPPRSDIIALDEHGELWDTLTLANHIKQWQMASKDIALLIGGADGFSEKILKKADKQWSLSPLTFPHMLVRVMVAEQLYRALSILSGHPYHRV